jgi:hypothetical protein
VKKYKLLVGLVSGIILLADSYRKARAIPEHEVDFGSYLANLRATLYKYSDEIFSFYKNNYNTYGKYKETAVYDWADSHNIYIDERVSLKSFINDIF